SKFAISALKADCVRLHWSAARVKFFAATRAEKARIWRRDKFMVLPEDLLTVHRNHNSGLVQSGHGGISTFKPMFYRREPDQLQTGWQCDRDLGACRCGSDTRHDPMKQVRTLLHVDSSCDVYGSGLE